MFFFFQLAPIFDEIESIEDVKGSYDVLFCLQDHLAEVVPCDR